MVALLAGCLPVRWPTTDERREVARVPVAGVEWVVEAHRTSKHTTAGCDRWDWEPAHEDAIVSVRGRLELGGRVVGRVAGLGEAVVTTTDARVAAALYDTLRVDSCVASDRWAFRFVGIDPEGTWRYGVPDGAEAAVGWVERAASDCDDALAWSPSAEVWRRDRASQVWACRRLAELGRAEDAARCALRESPGEGWGTLRLADVPGGADAVGAALRAPPGGTPFAPYRVASVLPDLPPAELRSIADGLLAADGLLPWQALVVASSARAEADPARCRALLPPLDDALGTPGPAAASVAEALLVGVADCLPAEELAPRWDRARARPTEPDPPWFPPLRDGELAPECRSENRLEAARCPSLARTAAERGWSR